MQNLRDSGIRFLDTLLEGKWKAPGLQPLQRDLAKLTDAQRDVVRRTVTASIDTAVHDLLFALHESHDRGTGVELSVDGRNAAEMSDGLHGELFGRNGWQPKYS